MAALVYPVDEYRYSKNDRLLLDTNIWLFLFGPQYNPSDTRVVTYSAAWKKILDERCKIFIDVLILSEFVNASARYFYNTLPPSQKPRDFKTFRKSAQFKPIAKGIAADCRRILNFCARIDSGFAALDTTGLLNDFESGKMDINDQLLLRLCAAKNFILVTDDADFKGRSVKLLTCNRALLSL